MSRVDFFISVRFKKNSYSVQNSNFHFYWRIQGTYTHKVIGGSALHTFNNDDDDYVR